MINLTDLAKEKVKIALDKRGRGIGIKIGVRTTGCSGMAYTIEFVDSYTKTEDYIIQDYNNFQLLIEEKHLPYIRDMVMDWKKQGLNEGFDFFNPNEKGRCGCGESFNV
jgi:iron-sulfur cluster assembly protein